MSSTANARREEMPEPAVVPGHPTELLEIDSDNVPVETSEDESQYPTGLSLFLVIVSVGLVLILSCMDATIVFVAVP